ncbi:MAG: Type-4 uracil-DNA glycosylase [Turneriella sp.]|nr:Type-4 uracil-DNA glycosylase [Turneriella sp.]
MRTLEELRRETAICKRCRLSATRTNVVFGEGNPNADLMFIGEGPGKDEDLTGRPFIGRAGMLLTRIIENGLKIKREDVYIANIVKCRATVNGLGLRDRPPEKDEVDACAPFLREQISLVSPKVIVTLGNPATRFILQKAEGITKLRGKWGEYNGIAVMPTYHPSFLLRNGGDAVNTRYKREVWNDMKLVMQKLGLPL